MFCTKCGKPVPDSTTTCPFCSADLSYESGTGNIGSRKNQPRKASRLGTVLVCIALAGLIAEAVWLYGYAPEHIRESVSSIPASAGDDGQAVVDLIPTLAPDSSPTETPEPIVPLTEPTPTPFVTP